MDAFFFFFFFVRLPFWVLRDKALTARSGLAKLSV